MSPSGLNRRRMQLAGLVILAVAGALLLLRFTRRDATSTAVTVEPVARRDIALTVEATGTVEPIDLVEVKSKASGQIVQMPVQVGSTVSARDLLAQIDPRDVRNQHAQALATVRAADAKLSISSAQKQRADALYTEQVITAEEHEAATLDFANAEAQGVKARTDLDLAQQRLEDATVRAPIAGTIIEQLVANGQVISSATSSASGGTTLLKMADLSRIRLRTLVAESDIGNVRAGQVASVTVDAFPQRTFQGLVEKVEPQAVVQQSVTMFPVLISLSNDDRALLPGMNGEVSMLIEERQDVPAVPVDAVRTVRELPVVAATLGLDAKTVSAELQSQMEKRRERRMAFGAQGDSAGEGGGSARTAMRAQAGSRPGIDAGNPNRRTNRGGSSATNPDSANSNPGNPGGSIPGARAGGAPSGRAQAVFVKTAQGIEPRLVRLGLSDFDYAEVLDGLKEGDEVVMLSVAEVQAKRTQDQERIRERLGSGVPGQPGAGAGGGRGGGGGGR